MNDQLYAKFKLMLLKYDFTNSTSFTALYNYSKQYGHGVTFKRFVSICKNMGVISRVQRGDDGLRRVLTYDKSNDKYVKGEIMALQPCATCAGSGVVSAPVKVLPGSV